MRKSIAFYVFVMLENISYVRGFLTGLERTEFMGSPVTQDAVMWCVSRVAQATGSVPGSVRSRYHDVPWAMMEGLRDGLEDEHFNVDADRLWKVATEELLPLEDRLQVVLAELDDEEGNTG